MRSVRWSVILAESAAALAFLGACAGAWLAR
jgi:hypothetical protein